MTTAQIHMNVEAVLKAASAANLRGDTEMARMFFERASALMER